MTNLKKTLAVVLAFAMILSMGAVSTFAAYSDVTAGTVVSEAVDILSGLNILTGFEDGTFKPEETVTRAQMAAIICRTLGYEDQAQSSMGTTVFNDVAADHWASGYINVAQAQQIINGYGDGNYGPEDKVTYEQAVKMIVSALGYDIAAAAKGGYPTGYLAIASAEGITKSANGKVGDAATRGTIAVLVYNSLEVRLMDQNSWSTDGTDTYGKDNKNILTNYLDVVKVEGIVTDNALTDVAYAGQYQADADSNVTIDGYGWIFDQYNSQGYSDYKKVALSQVDALDNDDTFDASYVDVTGFLGKYVIAYVGEDEVTGKNTVLAIAESKSKNDSLKISATQLVEAGQKYDTTANTIGYTEVGASRIKDLTLDANVEVYKNYDVQGGTINTTAALRNLVPNGGIIEFISNDADSDIEYILVTSYDKEAVIEKIEEVNGVYRYETYTAASLDKIDVEDEDKLFVVYKDGVAATAADLAVNDTVSCVKVAKNFWIYYASSATVTGTVDAYSTDDATVTIGGTDYEVTNVYYYDHDSNAGTPEIANVKRLSGEEGIFFLNVDGKIAHNETAPTSVGKYALIAALYKETKVGTAVDYITVVLADGTVAEYELDDTAELQDSNGENGTPLQTALAAALTEDATVNGETVHRANASDITGVNANKLLVKLTVNGSGKVTKARTLEGTPGVASGDKYDETSFSVGSVDFQEDAVIFSVKTPVGHNYIDADDVKVGTLATFFADEETYTLRAYDEDGDSIFGAGVGMDLAKAIAVDSSVFVVSSKKTITYNDEEAYAVTGMMAGEDVSITIYNEDNNTIMTAANSLVAGDVILISEPDAEGVVSDIQKLVDFNKSTPGSTPTPATTTGAIANDEIASGYGLLTSATNSKFTFAADVKYDHNTSLIWNDDQVANTSSISYKTANYTLVDFSENNKTPELVAETAGKSLFDTAYVTYVYVRVVEDKVADVVVYRMEETTDLEAVAATPAGNIAVGTGAGSLVFNANVVGATVTATATKTGTVTVTPASNAINYSGAVVGDTITVTVNITKAGYTSATATFAYTVVANPS